MIGAFGRPVRMKTGPIVRGGRAHQRFAWTTSSAGAITTKSGQRAGQRDLLDAHLRRAVLADRNAAVRAHHLQIQRSDRPPQTRSCSKPLFMTNTEKLETNGILPAIRQARADRRPCWLRRCRMRRSGREIPLRNTSSWWTSKGPRRTPRRPCSRGPVPPASRPKASRVATPSLISNLFCAGIY